MIKEVLFGDIVSISEHGHNTGLRVEEIVVEGGHGSTKISVNNGIQFYGVQTEMTTLPTSNLSFSQIRDAAGLSGQVSMSQMAPYYGVPRINASISAFVRQKKAMVYGLQYCVFGFYGSIGYYFADDPNWFSTRTENYSGLSSNFSSIYDGTAGVVPNNDSWDSYSVEWTGYFYATVTGTHTFYTQSDDASYMWMGATALTGFTTGNCLINNGGGHSMKQAQGSISLTAGSYYPIRIQFGEGGGGDNCYISFEAPGISRINNLTGYVFHPLGTKSTFPGYSARLIKAASGTMTDGIYYINTNGTSTPTYCLMDNKWNGGGWMMMMKATRGTTFNYSSTYWTDTGTTLNTSSTDQTDANAKFNTMNYVPVKDVLAIWPDVGYTGGSIASTGTWTWLVNNYYGGGSKTTIVNGFSSANTRDSPDAPDPLNYSGFSYSIWSTQNPSRRHIFGGGNHLVYAGSTPNLHVRWGFLFNENDLNDYRSIDVHGGIGMEGGSYSAGDLLTCCQASVGLNRTMRFELYGR